MKEEEKQAICRHWVELKNDIRAKDLTQHFISALVLSPDDDDRISASSVQSDRNDAFLKTIMKKGPKAFETLISALRKENYEHLASLLENELKKIGHCGRAEDQTDCVAVCPKCKRPIQCPACTQPTYDDGFSYQSGGLAKARSFPSRASYPSSSSEYNTIPKSAYHDSKESQFRYEPLRFGEPEEIRNQPRISFGLDVPDSAVSPDPESPDIRPTVSADISDDESNTSDYVNVPPKYPDKRKINMKSPLKLPISKVDPEVENDPHFAYYKKHLGLEEGWYPNAYRIKDIEELMKDRCEKDGQYLIWYEGTVKLSPYISVNCEGASQAPGASNSPRIIRHFQINTSPKTENKKRVFFIDSSYEFHRLEELLEHVKRYGILLDKEFSQEAPLY